MAKSKQAVMNQRDAREEAEEPKRDRRVKGTFSPQRDQRNRAAKKIRSFCETGQVLVLETELAKVITHVQSGRAVTLAFPDSETAEYFTHSMTRFGRLSRCEAVTPA